MIESMKILAVIPARGGSKGIPQKNIKILAGKPLIQYTIDEANKSLYIDDVVVSTDDNEISKVSETLGAKVIRRPDELSGDNSLVVDALRYTIEVLKKENLTYDIVLLLEPTSPLRSYTIIDECIEKFKNKNVESVTTFSETSVPPDRIWRIDDNNVETYIKGVNPWLPRQKLEPGYQLNGLVYAIRMSSFEAMKKSNSLLTSKITAVITPKEVSIDIDDMLDFKLIEFLMEER